MEGTVRVERSFKRNGEWEKSEVIIEGKSIATDMEEGLVWDERTVGQLAGDELVQTIIDGDPAEGVRVKLIDTGCGEERFYDSEEDQ